MKLNCFNNLPQRNSKTANIGNLELVFCKALDLLFPFMSMRIKGQV